MNRTESVYFELPHNRISDAVLSGDILSSSFKVGEMKVKVGKVDYRVACWGSDNQLPYQIKKKVEKNSVMSQNKFFNLLTCYGRGLEYMDVATLDDEKPKPTRDPDIRRWLMRNSFEIASKATGRIEHVLFANWEDNDSPEDVEVIPLLDEMDPLGDLLARTGAQQDIYSGFKPDPAKVCKYAVVCKLPTPGCQYYPVPYYSAVFRDGWYDIYGLLTSAKKAKIKNGQNIRYHVEINTEFWENRARAKGITLGSTAFEEMKTDFINDLKSYLGGSDNSDKVIWSEFQALVTGDEKRYLKINVVDTSKAGSEYNDDVAEASNVLCYDDNVHPNLAGATPGKSQMNNSGSDKRELFTMKQSLETLSHDMLATVHRVVIFFNRWEEKVEPVVPMILLTTLDKNTDAKQVDMNNNGNINDDGNNQGNQ